MKKQCIDHLGNEFESKTERAKYWGLESKVIDKRLNSGFSLEEALTKLSRSQNQYTDHLGNVFKSKKERAEFYNHNPITIDGRLKNGMSLEEALTTPVGSIPTGKSNKCIDHLGNEFESEKEMCSHWGIKQTTYITRKQAGYTLKEILTNDIGSKFIEAVGKSCKDHLGNKFPSIKEMCKYWEIPVSIYNSREKRNLSLEHILTDPIPFYLDHLGNKFESEKEMCSHWGVNKSLYYSRKRAGWDLERRLTVPSKNGIYFDPIRNINTTVVDIAEYYNISAASVSALIKKKPFIRLVKISFSIKSNHNIINQSKYNLTVSKRIKPGKDVFECYIDNGDGTSTFKIMTYEMIDQYCLEQYKKLHNIA